VLLGGDYVGGKTDGASIFYPEVARLKAPLGIYAVLGNHDVWEGADQAVGGLSKAGIRVLDNESVRVRKGNSQIVVAGLEDLYTGHPDAVIAGRDVHPSDFAVLISHNPDALAGQLPVTSDLWDLALAGHTHGGQVTFFGLFAPIVATQFGQRYRTGWKSEEGVPILVTNGVGTVTVPLRFFARAEIHVITLRRG
jgi:predicted MPP superfamily phosphohydrolase